MVDPAEEERAAMLKLLAQPVPGTVGTLPVGPDTTPRPYFPADGQARGRRASSY